MKRVFSHDVRVAMLVFLNKEIAAMMVNQTNPPGIKLCFYANDLICFSNPIWLLVTRVKTLHGPRSIYQYSHMATRRYG